MSDVIIHKRSFEPFCVWILFQKASSHSVSDLFWGVGAGTFIYIFYSLDPTPL